MHDPDKRPLRPFAVFKDKASPKVEVLCRTRTEALIAGAELLDLQATELRAIPLYNW